MKKYHLIVTLCLIVGCIVKENYFNLGLSLISLGFILNEMAEKAILEEKKREEEIKAYNERMSEVNKHYLNDN